MDVFDIFDLVSVVYAIFAAGVVVKLVRNGGRTFDDELTREDRRIAGAAVFYLGVPIAIALHELGHAVTTWALRGTVADYHYVFYWGYVVPAREPPLSAWESALTAASGNVVSLLVAIAAIAWTVRRPSNAARNFARLELARVLLWMTLAIYPVGSLLLDGGDFWILRRDLNALAPFVGDGAMLAYGGVAVWVLMQWRGPWRRRYLWLATPLRDRLVAARQRALDAPDDPVALRELGRVHLAGDDPHAALEALGRALSLGPDEPAEAHFLAGLAHLRAGAADEASRHLRAAGQHLERLGEDDLGPHAALYFEITLGLATARLALHDAEGAALTAEAAERQQPRDPRAILVRADALVAAGRVGEARDHLEAAQRWAEGVLAREIRRRIQALP